VPSLGVTQARHHTLRSSLAALILLGIAVAVLTSLGRWQLHRADERRAIRQTIEAGRRQAPIELSAATPTEALQPWRAASAQGVWRNDLTVLVDNRNLNGKPGLWVATPLQGDDGAAVLVLRGWLPRSLGALDETALVVPRGAPGVQRISGELANRVPRLFELPGQRAGLPDNWPQANRTIPRVQNIDLTILAAATGLNFLPTVLLQTSSDPNDNLLRDWPQPSLDADKNIGYAIQWFSFAAIAAIAWLAVLWRALRRRHGQRRCDHGDNTASP